jgi:hypothetical protein
MATATGPAGHRGQGGGDAPAHEVVAVFVGATAARTAAWRLLRAGLRPDQMTALSRDGPIELRPGRRPGAGRTRKVVGAVAAGALVVAAGPLLVALAGRTLGDAVAVVALLLVVAVAGVPVVGLRGAFRGAGGPARRMTGGAEPASAPGRILLAVRARTAEQAREARTLLRQYGGAAVSVYQVDPAADCAVSVSAG